MTISNSHKLDDLTPHQLIDEVRQIAEQYGREVTTSRRTWPKSLKDRILALARLGVPRPRIDKECGVPIATVSLWCKNMPGKRPRAASRLKGAELLPEARFLALEPEADLSHSNPTVRIVTKSTQIDSYRNGLQILLPGGIEVRGLSSVEQILAIYRGCRT